ncbi:hypothetical protein [Faucicola atlantae]|uniref:hypothetical protein n=1 Tax=Faucicola atlantae TaxID=34059 RepID=UPI0025AF27A4|nr:hypothetical protein [Moraxella atlantae]
MKKVLSSLTLVVSLTSCGGGFDGFDGYMTPSDGGSTKIVRVPSIGSTNSNNNQQSAWAYRSYAEGSRVFQLEAMLDSVNEYQMVDYPSLKGHATVNLEKKRSASGGESKRVVIFALSDVNCKPSCQVVVRGNSSNTFTMRNSIAEAIEGIDAPTNDALYKIFTSETTVTADLPLTKEGKWRAEFNTRGFDTSKMEFITPLAITMPTTSNNPFNTLTNNAVCNQYKNKSCEQLSCAEAYTALKSCSRADLDNDKNGTPCDKQCS